MCLSELKGEKVSFCVATEKQMISVVCVCVSLSFLCVRMKGKVRRLGILVLCHGPRLGQAQKTVIRTCQCAGKGNADKFQIVSIADERFAEDARGVTHDLPLLNKSHLPSSSRLPQAGKGAGTPTLHCPSTPSVPNPSPYLHSLAPTRPHPPPPTHSAYLG